MRNCSLHILWVMFMHVLPKRNLPASTMTTFVSYIGGRCIFQKSMMHNWTNHLEVTVCYGQLLQCFQFLGNKWIRNWSWGLRLYKLTKLLVLGEIFDTKKSSKSASHASFDSAARHYCGLLSYLLLIFSIFVPDSGYGLVHFVPFCSMRVLSRAGALNSPASGSIINSTL